MEQTYVFVYTRPNVTHATQLPQPQEKEKKYQGMFDEAYLDYIYAAMSLMRFVLLGLP